MSEKTITTSSYDKTKNNFEISESDLALLNANPDIAIEKYPLFLYVKSKLDTTELNLKRTKIFAPSSGILIDFTLKPGDRILSDLPVSTFIWIEANFKEIEISVGTYPDLKLHGIVESITTVTGPDLSILPAQNKLR
ncbi:MAG: hypothetical protein AB8U25_04365 [Rickettsiales endosymbiont of Dermacentor nuttalli]